MDPAAKFDSSAAVRDRIEQVRCARRESLTQGLGATTRLAPGVEFRELVSGKCGAEGFSTGLVTIQPGAALPYHLHRFSEAVTILAGELQVAVEGRTYILGELDCIHMPAGAAHGVCNPSIAGEARAHCTFAANLPTSELVENVYVVVPRGGGKAEPGDPEFVARFAESPMYELAAHAEFRDLFGAKYGAAGICGGYGRFAPGSSLPCHYHAYDESITIIEGDAVCQVQGRESRLSGCDTAFVPAGRVHRFLNRSDAPMAMVWVYAGDFPERTVVDASDCEGNRL